ncbi:MAG: putative serine/threonine protein phosphatase [Stictis urceolatum]|nr:putative serine/threonine protein phosphatase [Stictis urceolata]
MKLVTKFLTIVLGFAASVAAAPDPRRMWCGRPGEGCWKLARSIDVAARALAESGPAPDSNSIACYAPGAPCNVAKREALEFAETVAEAHQIANPGKPRSGISVGKFSRSRINRQPLTSMLDKDAFEKRRLRTDWCGRPGEGCTITKRDTEALTDALEAVPEEPIDESEAAEKRSCYDTDGICAKAKRAVDYLEARLNA